ncbi:ABC transporter permease [Actinobacteria bacterium YIM 96077]|uniref:Transport permease protein n=2 Tax=Phytoactinopolyspora halophila TaxID=1981511 RepID=A0A329QPP3_9ACTN|nr:ABC transporter permease [Actinobacteria bacterium YIM 96077]RAW14136.1 ABC transporter permease [Phytoactinopolyspora halophila]
MSRTTSPTASRVTSRTIPHTFYLAGRSLRILRREPAYLAFTLAQPMVWLLLFSQLFERVADLPGFGDVSYITYLTPGVVVMTALMSANWAGTSFIEDMTRGVMDRNLTSPVSRGALINGILAYQSVITIVQSAIILGVAFLIGARYEGGAGGVLTVIAATVLLAIFFAALSCAMALTLRSQESLIGMSMFIALPLMFLSSALMAPELMPDWVGTAASFNPVNWAAVASREALLEGTDWEVIATRGGLLCAAALIMGWVATRAFRTYQRSA